jgi:heat shock protein HslJ
MFMNLSKLILIASLALLSACSSVKHTLPEVVENAGAVLQLNDIWALESIQGEALLLSGDIKRPMLEINLRDMKVIGNDSCNGIFASIDDLDSERITFGPIAGTLMLCHPMEIAGRFKQQLNNVKTYQLKELKLHFFDEAGEELLTFRKVD